MVLISNYSHAAPTITNKINNTTINAKPPPYELPIVTPPLRLLPYCIQLMTNRLYISKKIHLTEGSTNYHY